MRTFRLTVATLVSALSLWAGESARAVATVTGGFITAITVTSGGAGYATEPKVVVSGGNGSGATARAFLNGDKVSQVVVLTAGSAYTGVPLVTIQPPSEPLVLQMKNGTNLSVRGLVGNSTRIESAVALSGPWYVLTNILLSSEWNIIAAPSAAEKSRFYRAVNDNEPSTGPTGFVWITPGTFQMGSPSAFGGSNEEQHTAILTRGFWLCDHETTQAEYLAVMGINPSFFRGGNLPVERVTWYDASAYCRKLTERERAAGKITGEQAYRIPTEAEWEYAARAGTTGERYGELNAIGWYSSISGAKTHTVKGKQPNAWGLYDMLGNVAEWCGDWFGGYPTGEVIDPSGPISGSDRVFRGGSWFAPEARTRSAVRDWTIPSVAASYLGFRPALFSINIEITIDVQPEPVTVTTGQVAVFSVAATGTESLSYQWQKNRTNLTGATRSTLTLTNAQAADAGDYRVVVANSKGSIYSATVKLAVEAASGRGPAGFVWLAPGKFVIGSPKMEVGRDDDELQNIISLTRGFWLSDHETTQAEYLAVMGTNPSFFKGDNLPVEQVTWDDAAGYCKKLTERERTAGRITSLQEYRLPTEAEWEYAARAGTTAERYGELDAIAWFNGNSSSKTHSGKGKQPNAWGLYDMLGNVWEWCSDWYDVYPTGSVTDPTGPSSGRNRVARGGSWRNEPRSARSADRDMFGPSGKGPGFRPVLGSPR